MAIPKDNVSLWIKLHCFPLTEFSLSGVILICEFSGWRIESQTPNQTDWVSLTEAPLNYTVEYKIKMILLPVVTLQQML